MQNTILIMYALFVVSGEKVSEIQNQTNLIAYGKTHGKIKTTTSQDILEY